MDLLGLGQSAGALPPMPLPPMPLPAGGGALPAPALPAALPLGVGVGVPPLPGGKPAPLKTSSLSRLDDLQAYLRQCDDQHYLEHFVKVLTSMPRDLLAELTGKLKARSAWLSAEEQREYKRAKLLNVMGAPCGSPGGAARSPGAAAGCAAAAADADAFCSQVLAGGGGGTPLPPPRSLPGGGAAAAAAAAAADGMQLERLDMDLGAHSFRTPADAAKTRMRVLPQQPSTGAAAPPAQPSGAAAPLRSPDDAPAGVTDHQIVEISPDGQPATAGAGAAAAAQPGRPGGGMRSGRQMTLAGGKVA